MHLMTYYGGKARPAVRKFVQSCLPTAERFVDLYGGGGSVLLSRPPSRLDVYNDLNHDLVRLFRTVRDRPDELERAVALTPHSRSEYNLAKDRPAELDDVEFARRFLIQLQQSFSGSQNSGWSKSRGPQGRSLLPRATQKWVALAGRVGPVAERLLHVQIDCRPALDCIELYDHEDTLFYADPPYLASVRNGGRRSYGEFDGMTAADHARLIWALSAAKGMAAVSGYVSREYEVIMRGVPAEWDRYDAAPIEVAASYAQAAERGTRIESLWIKRRK